MNKLIHEEKKRYNLLYNFDENIYAVSSRNWGFIISMASLCTEMFYS